MASNLVAICAYFNLDNNEARLRNYKQFYEHITEVQGIPLYTIEGYKDAPQVSSFQNTISIKCSSVVWQKERLLNILLSQLPSEYDSVAWVDCDVTWKGKNIKKEIEKELNTFKILQPWSKCNMIGSNGRAMLWPGRNAILSTAFCSASHGRLGKFRINPNMSHPGFAWAARRDVIDSVKFYDALVTGAGDIVMCLGFFGDFESKFLKSERMSHYMLDHWNKWAKNANEVIGGNISFVEEEIYHMYHGELKDRRYTKRWRSLAELGYNPYTDIKQDECSPIDWSDTASKELKESVKDYINTKQFMKPARVVNTVKDRNNELLISDLKRRWGSKI